VSFKDRIKSLQQKDTAKDDKQVVSETDAKQHLLPSTSGGKPKKLSTTQQLKDRIKSFSQIPKDELTPWSKLKLATVVSLGGSYSSLTNSLTGDSPKLSKTTAKSSMPADLNAVTQLDVPLTASSSSTFPPESRSDKTSVSDSELKNETAKVKRKPRPFKLKSEPKSYQSVDDLSPEYSGLPFVKKLKILNERQKLAELESAIQTRSFSLDCTDSSNSTEMVEGLTRSHSEASCMASRPKSPSVPTAQLNFSVPVTIHVPLKSPQSPESNETLERKQLKSILKRLSEDRLAQNANVKGGERGDMKRLMRAQTMEGYVARRTKFTKSVTFNNTLSSPPATEALAEEPEECSAPNRSSPSPPPLPALPATQALYPIANAHETSTTAAIENKPQLLSNRTDHSTNRFNFTGEFVRISSSHETIQTIQTTESSPYAPPSMPNASDDPSRSLSFVSDDYGQRKIVKGI
jgi:hypothetical protein